LFFGGAEQLQEAVLHSKDAPACNCNAPLPLHEPGSTTDQPEGAGQSGSSLSVALLGQHASLALCALITTFGPHSAVHVAALPTIGSIVHELLSSHDDGQLPGGSHVSPFSMMPLPHFAEQSSSLFAFAFGGQQPSPLFGATST
jgi:hypothetical protein